MKRTSNEIETAATGGRAELARVAKSLLGFAGVFLCAYGVAMALQWRFPYLEAGADVVAHRKHALVRRGPLFSHRDGTKHLVIFGNSKTLSGFIPEVFDARVRELSGQAIESYNFGLPGDSRFMADLEAMIQHGNRPDMILLTVPWTDARMRPVTVFKFIANDQEILDAVFPFRKMPRNFALLLAEAHATHKPCSEIYAESVRTLAQVDVDRGYYFIARQSHFPNDALPANYRVPSDTPDVKNTRTLSAGVQFTRLKSLLVANGITCLVVPTYYRQGQYSPAAATNETVITCDLAAANISLVGRDYLLYPNPLFSDVTHLNRKGAAAYTRDLAGLVSGTLTGR